MQKIDIEQFLQGNGLVDGACVPDRNANAHDCRVEVNPSPSGHGTIRDQGIQEFRRFLDAQLPGEDRQEIDWVVSPAATIASLQDFPDADHSFPAILSLIEDAPHVRLLLDISPEMSWFRGHFPDQPVLPGVVQVHWAVIAAVALFGFSAAPPEIKRLKFKKVVVPPQVLELSLQRHSENEVQFEYGSLGNQKSLGRLVFAGTSSC